VFNYYHNKFSGKYHALIPGENSFIVSCSPELFLEKNKFILKTQPIKGTDTNSNFDNKILKNKKEEAELSMIVDLLRNDLNTVSNNVKITKHRKIMNLGNLVHTYSELIGETKLKLYEILPKILPAGSISGCPKSSSIFEIYNKEKFKRNFYTGNFGWWEKDDFTLNILIRSFIFLDNMKAYYHAGGGIVDDSISESEYNEIFLKGEKINA
jgi:para-aminobenzoate synthetase component 1